MREECYRHLKEAAEILAAEIEGMNNKTKEVLACNASMVKDLEAISGAWDQSRDMDTMEKALWNCIRIAEKAIATNGRDGKRMREIIDATAAVNKGFMVNAAQDKEKLQELCGRVEDLQTIIRHLRYKEKLISEYFGEADYPAAIKVREILDQEYELPGGERL